MKKIVHLTLVMSCYLMTVHGQEAVAPKPVKDFNDPVSSVHELGVNATFFVNTFFSFNTVNPTVVSPYALTYKFRKAKWALRFGVGGNYRATDQSTETNIFKTKNSGVDVRLGGEYSIPFGNRWRSFFGVDAVVGYANSSSESGQPGFLVITDITSLGFGGGPVIGLDFVLAKRIKIGTETSVMFQQTDEVQLSRFENSGIEDQESKNSVTEVVFNLPTSLYLIIMF